jgi:hypothetical protein
LGNIVFTCSSQIFADGIGGENGSCVVAAKGDIEDDFMVLEFVVYVTGALEIGLWNAPLRGVGISRCDIRRNRCPWEGPDSNVV